MPARSHQDRTGVRLYDVGQDGNGIVHVVGPELGLSLPGLTIVCGDSHTCTHGALGAIAFGIGSTEIQHVLATQTLAQRRPRTLRAEFSGALPQGVGAKDMTQFVPARVNARRSGAAAPAAARSRPASPCDGRIPRPAAVPGRAPRRSR